MLMNATLTTTEKVRFAIANSANQYYLTGSHYFGGWDHTSDWDFFVTDSEEVRAELNNLGFTLYSGSEYTDSHTHAVYRHTQAQIDVQLVKDAKVKQEVQIKIKAMGVMNLITTQTHRRNIWNALLP